MRRHFWPKFIEICTWWSETNRNICHWVLLQKREFISRRTQKHNNNTFSNTWAVQAAKFSKISHFFNYHNSSLRVSAVSECRVTQKLKNRPFEIQTIIKSHSLTLEFQFWNKKRGCPCSLRNTDEWKCPYFGIIWCLLQNHIPSNSQL